MSDKNTSTLQSYIDSAKSTGQSILGSLTGNSADKTQADQRQARADAEHDVSHASAKAGPFTLTAAGAHTDDPDRSAGSWNQTIGSGKEALGSLVGAEGLKSAGRRQNEEGRAQETQGQLSDLGGGMADRAKGAVGGAVAGLAGDRDAQRAYERQHDRGKAAQRSAEHDIDKQANY